MLKKALHIFFIIFTPFAILILSNQYALSYTITIFRWAESAGGSNFDVGTDIATDDNNNVFITGSFNNTATFGSRGSSSTVDSNGSADLFIAKYDTNGTLQWIRSAGANNWDVGNGITTDSSGNSIVTGMFQDTVVFGTGSSTQTLTSTGQEEIFVAKYDPDGKLLWAKQAGGNLFDQGQGIVTNQANDIFITGYFMSTATFSSTTIPADGHRAIFLAKYDSNGDLSWVRKASGPGIDESYDVTLDSSGNVIVTGRFESTVTFSTTMLTSKGGSDIFVAKYNSNGGFLWARQISSLSNDDYGYSVATNPSNDVFVTGTFGLTATIEGGGITKTLISAGSEDIFVVKYDTNGQPQWAKQAGGINSFDRGYDIIVDQAGNSYVLGLFQGIATFDSIQLTSAGGIDMFIAKYDINGNLTWIKQVGTSGSDDEGFGITMDTISNTLITGRFGKSSAGTVTLDFDGLTITSNGMYDVFVAKLENIDGIPTYLPIVLKNQ